MSKYDRCPVCGGTLKRESDRIEGTTIEDTTTCPECLLYHCDFWAGHSYQRVGFCEWNWSYNDPEDAWKGRSDQFTVTQEETGRLYRHPKWPEWKYLIGVGASQNRTALLVFADWLQENGFVLNERSVRSEVAEWDADSQPFEPPPVFTTCPQCDGAGERGCAGGYPETCDSCGGIGRVEVDETPTL